MQPSPPPPPVAAPLPPVAAFDSLVTQTGRKPQYTETFIKQYLVETPGAIDEWNRLEMPATQLKDKMQVTGQRLTNEVTKRAYTKPEMRYLLTKHYLTEKAKAKEVRETGSSKDVAEMKMRAELRRLNLGDLKSLIGKETPAARRSVGIENYSRVTKADKEILVEAIAKLRAQEGDIGDISDALLAEEANREFEKMGLTRIRRLPAEDRNHNVHEELGEDGCPYAARTYRSIHRRFRRAAYVMEKVEVVNFILAVEWALENAMNAEDILRAISEDVQPTKRDITVVNRRADELKPYDREAFVAAEIAKRVEARRLKRANDSSENYRVVMTMGAVADVNSYYKSGDDLDEARALLPSPALVEARKNYIQASQSDKAAAANEFDALHNFIAPLGDFIRHEVERQEFDDTDDEAFGAIIDRYEEYKNGPYFNEDQFNKYREINLQQFKFDADLTDSDNIREELEQWLIRETAKLDNICDKSDAYAEITKFRTISVTFKLLPIVGRGGVLIKADRCEELSKIIFNPTSDKLCFFECVAQSGFKWKGDVTTQKGKRPAAVHRTQLSHYASMLKGPCVICLHEFVAHTVVTSTHPKRYGPEHQVLNLGLVDGHYILIRDMSQLHRISSDDFFRTSDDRDPTLDTTKEVVVKPAKRGLNMWVMSDKEIQAAYQALDNSTVQYDGFAAMMRRGTCNRCCRQVAKGLWMIDSNDQLVCKGYCRKERKASEAKPAPAIWFWDCETYVDGDKVHPAHRMYNVGVLRHSVANPEDVRIFYGLDAQEKFEAFLVDLTAHHNSQIEDYIASVVNNKKAAYAMKDDDCHMSAAEEEKLTKLLRTEAMNAHKQIFYAHNGSRFDAQLLWKSKTLKFDKMIDANGIISLTLKGGLIEFRDSYRTISQSLADCCRSFKLSEEFRKTHFPHMFARADRLEYVGPVPHEDYWPITKDDDGNVVRIPPKFANCDTFDFKAVSIAYQKMDCVALHMVWDKYAAAMKECTGLNTCDFMTLPSLAIQYVLDSTGVYDFRGAIQPDITICTNHAVDKFIRESIQGGRCFPQKSEFVSKSDVALIHKLVAKGADADSQAQLKQLHADCNDYLTDLDATSLYPSAMATFRYPTGTPEWATDLESVKQRMTDMGDPTKPRAYEELPMSGISKDEMTRIMDNTDFLLGVIECDIEYPEHIEDTLVTPLLATHSQEGLLQYGVEPRHTIKTTIDIAEAIRCNGARVTTVHKALLWPYRRAYLTEPIVRLFEMRRKAKKDGNSALDVSTKLTMNSSYGKMSERPRNVAYEIADDGEVTQFDVDITNGLKVIQSGSDDDDDDELNDADRIYLNKEVVSDYILANNNQCMLGVKENPKPRRPAHVGSFILSFSKVIMNRAIEAVDGFKDWDHAYFYGDTDSMVVHKATLDKFKAVAPRLIGSDLGQLKDDISEVQQGKIIRGFFVRPKVYGMEILGLKKGKYTLAYHIRAKGVQKAEQEKITMDVLESLLRGEVLHTTMNRISSSFKDATKPALVATSGPRDLNKTTWRGRNPDPDTKRYIVRRF